MVKTVVVVLGCIGVLLGISPHPLAREQALPTTPPPSSPAPPESQTAAEQAAMDAAAKALDELRSKYRCTYALKMMEVDPDFDSKIRIESSGGGNAKIRRIGPPPCPTLQIQHKPMGGWVRITPAQKK
jgi:hypothetical protein